MKEIKLPSGATLKISVIPFAAAKALYQAILEEARSVKFDASTDMASVIKELVCVGFSSKKVEVTLWECMKRCLYNSGNGDLKIDDSTFEPATARQDYSLICLEVIMECISPFMKGLSAELGRVITMITSIRQ